MNDITLSARNAARNSKLEMILKYFCERAINFGEVNKYSTANGSAVILSEKRYQELLRSEEKGKGLVELEIPEYE